MNTEFLLRAYRIYREAHVQYSYMLYGEASEPSPPETRQLPATSIYSLLPILFIGGGGGGPGVDFDTYVCIYSTGF